MKFGDAVIYDEFGKKYNAIVIGVRDLADHAGENGEPLLHLVYAKESLDMHGQAQNLAGTGSWSKLLQMRVDVAHASHEFSDDAQKQFGKRYQGGRWEAVSIVNPPVQPKPVVPVPPAPVGK